MTRNDAARLAYLDQVREMFVDSLGLPAAPDEKGEDANLYKTNTATGGGSDA